MTTATTPETTESHLSQEEVEALAHPKRSGRDRFGVVMSYVGMGLIVSTASSRSTG